MPPFVMHEAIRLIFGIAALACGTVVFLQIIKVRGRQGASADAIEAYEKRLARLEVAIDDLTQAIGRVTEGQQFLTNVLSERGELSALPPKR
jgi:hypothetical protein